MVLLGGMLFACSFDEVVHNPPTSEERREEDLPLWRSPGMA